ncbi:MAG: cupredoxin domain-containing protein [Pseudohongiellaceae bacterium]|nr:cupredoxin domain-containing protein [Pseudohongiellaceae bacterium]
MKSRKSNWRIRVLFGACLVLPSFMVHAQTLEVELVIREHLFYPSELSVPAGQKIKLIVINEDATPEEFESYELNREKVIMGRTRGIVFIGPLKPGEYPFFGEFNIKTAQGKIIAQ